MEAYKNRIKASILNQEQFIRATFSGIQRGHSSKWNKMVIRTVLLKDEKHIQVSQFDNRKDITKNYTAVTIQPIIDDLLHIPFKNIHVEAQDDAYQVQITKKGKAIIHQHKVHNKTKPVSLNHDRNKNLLIPDNEPDPFLETIGIMTKDGKIRADKRKKYRQINEFLKLVLEVSDFEAYDKSPINLVDCGCGNAYLTFAVFYYLTKQLNLPTNMVGIDVTKSLLDRRTEQVQELGWQGLTFQQSTIIEYQPETAPNVVLALHACDTATDETLAQAIGWNSDMIFCAPCCHHHLQAQLNRQPTPDTFSSLMRHNVLKERMGDILTDGFRSMLLQLNGYKTDIVEFVSTEHTGKNLLIRAIKTDTPPNPALRDEYEALKALWQVEPYLETLLKDS